MTTASRIALKTPSLLLLAALAAGACDDRENAWNRPFDVAGPVSAGGRLAWLNRSLGMVVAIDPAGTATPLAVPVGTRPRALAATPTGVVVTGGRGDAPALQVVALPSGEVTTIPTRGAYDRAAVSADGRFAVLFYDPSATPAAGGPAARNNDELTVVDLPAAKAKPVALRTEALAPEFVVFSPANDLAVVALDSALAIVTLAAPDDHVVVPLKLPGGATLHPREVLFSPDGAFVYVRTENDDVLALAIDRTGAKIGASVNFLFFPGARGLADILVPEGPEFTHSVAALYADSSGSIIALLEATGDSSRTRSVAFSQPTATLADLGGGSLLAHPNGTGSQRFVGGWRPLVDRSDEDQLPGKLAAPGQVAGGAAWFAHPAVPSGQGSGAALTRVTLEDDGARLRVRLAPVVLGGGATAFALHAPTGTLVASVRVPRDDSGAAPRLEDAKDFSGTIGSLVAVNPVDLTFTGLAMDADVDALGFVGTDLFALHPGRLGDVTFVPFQKLERASAHRAFGFLASGLLDRASEVSP